MEQRSWPERCEVTVADQEGEAASFTIATWEGPAKAKALAVAAAKKQRTWPTADLNVAVRPLGPVAKGDGGVATPEGKDLLDRQEW